MKTKQFLKNISIQQFYFYKWKFGKEIKYSKCLQQKKIAEENLQNLLHNLQIILHYFKLVECA